MVTTAQIPVIAVTTGEPAGIGPELCAQLHAIAHKVHLVLLGDRELLRERGLSHTERIPEFSPHSAQTAGLSLIHHPLNAQCTPGELDHRNARYVLSLIDTAVQGCQAGDFDAMVTAPIHKGVINDAGIAFTGHTEYLAESTSTERVVMMLAHEAFRVVLATTHLPLKDVSDAITTQRLIETLTITESDLRQRFGIRKPRIQVCGLNPHAGESGHLGEEEIMQIQPAVDHCRELGMDLSDPMPADTAFTQHHLQQYDVTLAMYHDQGLPVLKHASFGHAVNITLGLPIIRVSVDHGTALDIAGKSLADNGSLQQAIAIATELAR